MLIDTAVKSLGTVPQKLIDEFANVCQQVDWSHEDFGRGNNLTIGSKVVRIPYGVRQDPYQPDTPQVLMVRDAFKKIDQWAHTQLSDKIFVKGEINYMFPNSILDFHYDPCWFHEHGSRIHIPIFTNPQCYWLQGKEKTFMPVGHLYEVNNRVLHSFWNNGTTGRVHVVLDILDKNLYNQAIEQNIVIDSFTIDPTITDPKNILDELLDQGKI